MLNWIITAIAIVAVIFLSISNKKPQKMDSSQDIFNFEEIYSDGLIRLVGHKFRRVMEVYPVNMAIRSAREQANMWDSFRTMINSLNIPVTILVQSTHLDNTDYVATIRDKIQDTENPALKKYGKIYTDHVLSLSENRSLQSKKYYIIPKIDISSNTIDSGVDISDNTVAVAINAVLKKAEKKTTVSTEEAERLARSELNNIVSVMGSYLGQMGIVSRVLDKVDVVNMGYTTYNRDLSNTIRTKDVNNMGAFSLFTRSATPGIYATMEEERDDLLNAKIS